MSLAAARVGQPMPECVPSAWGNHPQRGYSPPLFLIRHQPATQPMIRVTLCAVCAWRSGVWGLGLVLLHRGIVVGWQACCKKQNTKKTLGAQAAESMWHAVLAWIKRWLLVLRMRGVVVRVPRRGCGWWLVCLKEREEGERCSCNICCRRLWLCMIPGPGSGIFPGRHVSWGSNQCTHMRS